MIYDHWVAGDPEPQAKLANMTYEDLALAMDKMGFPETGASITNKIGRDNLRHQNPW